MGFGSYDESEQRDPEYSTDDEDDVENHHQHDHDGSMSFESGASTDDLLDRLDTIKTAAEDEE